ncbi:MAG: hypothetical protein AAFX41_10295, partial [Bacteroidota bacterium]
LVSAIAGELAVYVTLLKSVRKSPWLEELLRTSHSRHQPVSDIVPRQPNRGDVMHLATGGSTAH